VCDRFYALVGNGLNSAYIYIRADVVAVIGVLNDRRGFDAGDHFDRRNLEAM